MSVCNVILINNHFIFSIIKQLQLVRLVKIKNVIMTYDISYNTATSGTNFSPRSLKSLYSNFHCYGNESSPMNCLYSSSSCTSYYRSDAAVICQGDIAGAHNFHVYTLLLQFSIIKNTDSCPHNGSIRLVGPSGPNTVEGRVEYCSNGLWGTISSSGFDTRDGEVVCRQLGHQNPRELIVTISCLLYNA